MPGHWVIGSNNSRQHIEIIFNFLDIITFEVTTYLEKVRNIYPMTQRHIPEQEGHKRNVSKNSASMEFNFPTAALLYILFCWECEALSLGD
jgi:hypothetical protein